MTICEPCQSLSPSSASLRPPSQQPDKDTTHMEPPDCRSLTKCINRDTMHTRKKPIKIKSPTQITRARRAGLPAKSSMMSASLVVKACHDLSSLGALAVFKDLRISMGTRGDQPACLFASRGPVTVGTVPRVSDLVLLVPHDGKVLLGEAEAFTALASPLHPHPSPTLPCLEGSPDSIPFVGKFLV